MHKPTVFIGSSTENAELANTIQNLLEYDAYPIVWTQDIFKPSHYALESLESALDSADFAVLVCAPDDLTNIRGQEHATVRDNVIFELGMAIGRLSRKRTFLISPRGTEMHLPSDLEGLSPQTYDPNQTANLQAALGSACTKIRLAMKNLGPLQRPNAEAGQKAVNEAEKEPTENSMPFGDPAPDWGIWNYESTYFFALLRGNAVQAEQIDKSFNESHFASSSESLAVWQAYKELASMRAGQHCNVGLVRSQTELFPNLPRLHEILGQVLAHYGDTKSAHECFIAAIEASSELQTISRLAKRIVSLETPLVEAEQLMALRLRLLDMHAASHSEKVALVNAMESVALAANLNEIAASIAEIEISLAPEDINSRFELARRYADSNQNQISMIHYEAIPIDERSGGAWNNLGVSYSNLMLSGMATFAYEKAAEKKEKIANENLAEKYTRAGFYDEAQKKVEKSISFHGHDDSVIKVLSSIKEAREREETLHKSTLETGKHLQLMRMEIGTAAIQSSGPDIVGVWTTSDYAVEIFDNGDGSYTGFGQISKQLPSLGFVGLLNSSRIENRRIELILKRMGNALEGTITEKSSEKPLSLLGTIDSKRNLLLKISEDGKKISGFEISYSTSLIEWSRQEQTKPMVKLEVQDEHS